MAKYPSSLPPFGVSAVIRRSFAIFGAGLGTLFPIVFVPFVLFGLIQSALFGPLPTTFDPAVDTALPPGFWAMGMVGVVLQMLLTGIICLVAVDLVIGRSHGIGEYARQAARRILPLLVLGLLLTFGASIAAVFLVVPGLYVLARFLPWVETIVFENTGWSGLSRAQELTEGYRWPLVGALLAMTVIGGGLAVAATLLIDRLVGVGTLGLVLETVVQSAAVSLFAVFSAVVYVRLRELREGMSVQRIAESIG